MNGLSILTFHLHRSTDLRSFPERSHLIFNVAQPNPAFLEGAASLCRSLYESVAVSQELHSTWTLSIVVPTSMADPKYHESISSTSQKLYVFLYTYTCLSNCASFLLLFMAILRCVLIQMHTQLFGVHLVHMASADIR